MKTVLDLYKALAQRKQEVIAAAQEAKTAPVAGKHASRHETQTVHAAAVRRTHRTEIQGWGGDDFERV